MNSIRIGLFISLLLLILSSCKTAQTSMLIADSYDEHKNQTTLTLIPNGNIVIPGKWTKTDYLQASRQHFFKNSDSTTVAVTKNPKQKYPFFHAEQTDKEFVADFVKWDSEYWSKHGISTKTLIDRSHDGYILWQAVSEERNVNTIFLFGSKNGFAYNFSSTSKKWTEEEIKAFLVKMYNEN